MFGMRHEDRIHMMKAMHENLLARLEGHNPGILPGRVDREKLEMAYESLKGYSFVLKKR